MRFFITLTALAASAAAADLGSLLTENAGDCAGKCYASLFQDVTDCGDAFNGDNTGCYCEALSTSGIEDSVTTADQAAFQNCLSKCGGDALSNAISDLTKVQNEYQEVCNDNGASVLTTSKAALAAGALVFIGFAL